MRFYRCVKCGGRGIKPKCGCGGYAYRIPFDEPMRKEHAVSDVSSAHVEENVMGHLREGRLRLCLCLRFRAKAAAAGQGDPSRPLP